MSLIKEVIDTLKERKNIIESGKINGIPMPLKSLSNVLPSIERSSYILLTGGSKSGKTQCGNFLFIYNSVLYAYSHRDLINLHIILFPLEEGKEMTICRFISYLLYQKYRVRISPTDLRSSNSERPLPNNVLELVESKEIQDILNFFESVVQFEESNTSVGICTAIREYSAQHGKMVYSDETFIDEQGNTRHRIDHYEPNNPNDYTIVYLDHINLINPTKTQKGTLEAIEELSRELVKIYRVYKYIVVVLQQQTDSETNSLQAVMNGNVLATKAGLKNCKATGQDATLLLGISNPGSFQTLQDYMGYNLNRFDRKYFRVFSIIFNRFGESDIHTPLYFDGAVNHYAPLPSPDNNTALSKIYERIEEYKKDKLVKVKETNSKSKIFLLKSINKIFYKT